MGWILTKLNTKYLTVTDYGKYAFFIIIIYYSRTFFSFGVFESTSRLLALQANLIDKQRLFGASLINALLFVIPFGLLIFIFSYFIDSVFNVKIAFLCDYFAILVGLILIQSYLMVTLKGSGSIKTLAFITFVPRLFYLAMLAYIIRSEQFTIHTTILSLFIGLAVAILPTIVLIKPNFQQLRLKIKAILTENKRYGIHIYFGSILHETLFHADKLLISYFLDAKFMAYYGLAYMLTFPLSHFSTSLATTLYSKFASQKKINKKVLYYNFLFVSVTVTLFIILREPIIFYLFSDNYLPAVNVMLPLAMAFGFSGLSKPFTLFLMAKGEGRVVRNVSIIIPIINIVLNVFLIPIFGIDGAAWTAFIAYGVDLLLYYFYYKKIINI